jgi:ribosomal protein S26
VYWYVALLCFRLASGSSKKNRGEMMKYVDANYYGYMDDDDGLLIPSEEKCEREAIRKKVEQWKADSASDVTIDEAFNVPEMNVRLFYRSLV